MKRQFKLIIIALGVIPVLTFSQTNKNYITVDYGSICCGTPSEKPVMDFVENFEKKNKLKPFEIFVELGLGKEGEHTFYIGTDNLCNELLKSFLDGLKITISNQNKQRIKNRDGYVNLHDELIPNSTLKSLKKQPKTKISSLEIYNYKKQNFESFYGKTLRSKIKIVENDDMISGAIMFIKINKDYLGVSVESEIKQEFCAEIDYPEPTKLMYTKTKNSLIIDNSVQKNNNKYQLLSLTLRKEKMFGKVRVENKIEEFEFK